MNHAISSRRALGSIGLLAIVVVLVILLAGCADPTIPGWVCRGYHWQSVPHPSSLWWMVYHLVHYTPHSYANTAEIIGEIHAKYGYFNGIGSTPAKIRIPWGCIAK